MHQVVFDLVATPSQHGQSGICRFIIRRVAIVSIDQAETADIRNCYAHRETVGLCLAQTPPSQPMDERSLEECVSRMIENSRPFHQDLLVRLAFNIEGASCVPAKRKFGGCDALERLTNTFAFRLADKRTWRRSQKTQNVLRCGGVQNDLEVGRHDHLATQICPSSGEAAAMILAVRQAPGHRIAVRPSHRTVGAESFQSPECRASPAYRPSRPGRWAMSGISW